MLFTGYPISGKEAYECGLVSKVVQNDKLGESLWNIIAENIRQASLELSQVRKLIAT